MEVIWSNASWCAAAATTFGVYITDDFLLLSGVALLEHSLRSMVIWVVQVVGLSICRCDGSGESRYGNRGSYNIWLYCSSLK
ncbi:hypothetical protein E3N88_03466 [Mikania micrantha]|uniref:Uncharacterized protein n=1 Tax=Mikania micrantha TaxID=192012 RepID=A0A5N6Q9H9_9ASTR|nr:hypothetical protein E3N88_03466 [Mikania micrantha]